ncbi:ribosomal RNA large subunit methyltransferase E [Kordiimonas sediminis]|uniref:Ribosomal RNA large subunit methyltransferase E n=1 Tax=Kordiimonas sediminis TaxID=1735581 RepID=A0A919AX23_9PROT|nr:RlmE family RNA methyltransferase [Kordiimonas sediminis]GHF27214.1 ribosomal RNA large subunit methyltransferase E [Kordiimonas sediminis]
MAKGWNRQSETRSRTRGAKVKVKTARGRKNSSTRWLQRQLNDPYVAEAQRLGYRSRAAFKLKELNERFGFLKGANRVVDLGCAPGGWLQVLMETVKPNTQVLGIDLQEVEPVQGAKIWVMDFLSADAEQRLMNELDGPADVVLSDMANSATGHKETDHIRTMALCEAALDFALKVLAKDGSFVAKVIQGGSDSELMNRMKTHFKTVKHAKPPSSRQDSKEWFVVAQGFKGLKSEN